MQIDIYPYDPDRDPGTIIANEENPVLVWNEFTQEWDLTIPNDGNPTDHRIVAGRDEIEEAIKEAESFIERWMDGELQLIIEDGADE